MGPKLSSAPVLEVRDLTKSFLGQVALESVSLSLARREARALIGHNGSGKSTLIKCLAGVYRPDAGEVEIEGERLDGGNPESSRRAGLRFVHQDLGLVDGLNVLENLKLGSSAYDTAPGRRIRWRRERRAARALLEGFDLRVEPDAPVSDLSPVERTKLAVARAVQDADSAAVLVLDEPTASLPAGEVEHLFAIVRGAINQGLGVLYVSHRLEEIYEVCDTVTVLRDGEVVGQGSTEELDRATVASLIVGGEESRPPAPPDPGASAGAAAGDPVLAARGLAGGNLEALDLEVRPGEIVGLAGLAGSGVHDLVGLLLGQLRRTGGSIDAGGSSLEDGSPWGLSAAGIAALPAARELKAIQSMNVRENLSLPDLAPLWRRGRLRRKIDRQIANELIASYDVRPPDPERPMATLSGGNQQKVCVARWMRTEPKVFVLDEPTAGVDVGGRAQILEFLREGAQRGMGIVVCSSDLDDLAEVCTRVVILRGGVTVGGLTGKEITRERIAAECYRSSAGDDGGSGA